MLSLFKPGPLSAGAIDLRVENEVLVPAAPGKRRDAGAAAHEIPEILEQHRKWVTSQGRIGRCANLTGADLSGADLSRVNLQGASLRKASLAGADLSLADLRGACLIQANLRKANLLGTTLREAALQGANLEGVSGLRPEQLGGANLFGATLPQQISELRFQKVKVTERASQRVRWLFVTMLLANLCGLLVVVTTTDARLLRNAPLLPVPYIGEAVPLVEFYLIFPLLLLFLYVGFHVGVLRLWAQVSELPAVFPDGLPLDKKGRWLLMDLTRKHLKRLGEDRLPPSWLESAILVIPAYWAVPLTLVFFWARYLTRMNSHATGYHTILILAATVLATVLPGNLAQVIRAKTPAPLGPMPAVLPPGLLARGGTVLSMGVLLALLSVGIIHGVPHHRGTSEIGDTDPRRWAPETLWWMGYDPYPNVAEAEISRKPLHWTGREQEFASVQGARLDNLRLRYVEAFRTFLVNARLRHTDLENANLGEADLRGANLYRATLRSAVLDRAQISRANLEGAHLEKTSLVRVDLSGTDLSYARLAGANLMDAKLTGCNLYAARLRGASLLGANLKKADLREANLENARLGGANLEGAYLWSAKLSGAKLQDARLQNALLIETDLRRADLRGADLQKALLRRAVLEGANVDGADLRGAIGLTVDQLCSAVSWDRAQIDESLRQDAVRQCLATP